MPGRHQAFWSAALLVVALGVVIGWSARADAHTDQAPRKCRVLHVDGTLEISLPPRLYEFVEADVDALERACGGDAWDWLRCRDERDGWPDTHGAVAVAPDVPTWWTEAIGEESTADEGRGCGLAQRPPVALCGSSDRHSSGGLVPDECWGTYPSENYQLAWKDGGPFDFKNKMQGWLGGWMYNIGKGAVLAVLWLLGWAFRFDVTDFTRSASTIAGSYEANIVGPFKLEDMVWFALIVWAGFAALRHKLGMAAGEIAVAIVLAGLSTVLFAHRADYMDSVADLMDETSARLLVAGQPERCLPLDAVPAGSETHGQAHCGQGDVLVTSDPARPADLPTEIRPLQKRIHQTFVEQPWAFLNWGRMPTDRCLEAQNQIAATGYTDDGWPERHMSRVRAHVGDPGMESELNDPGSGPDGRPRDPTPQRIPNSRTGRVEPFQPCGWAADFVKDPTGTRMIGAFLNMATSLVIALILGLMALALVLSKFMIAVLFALVPFAAVGGVLPGIGRRLAWSWVGILVQAGATQLLSAFLLVFVLVGVDSVPRVSERFTLLERQTAMLIIAAVAFAGRKRGVDGAKRLGEYLTDSLTRMTPGGAGWSGQARGIDVAAIDRGAGRALGATTSAAGFAAGWGLLLGGSAAFAVGRGATRSVLVRRAEARNTRRSVAAFYGENLSYRQAEDLPPLQQLRSGDASAGGGGGPQGGRPHGQHRRPAEPDALPPGSTGAADLHREEPPPKKTFMLYRGAPANVDPTDRRQLWNYARKYEDYEPVWDTASGRFFHPFQARQERKVLERHVRYQQRQTRRYLWTLGHYGALDLDNDQLVDRFGNEWRRGHEYHAY